MRVRYNFIFFILVIFFYTYAAKYNAFGLKFFTRETEHFRIHYHAGLEHLVPRVAYKCEELYNIYKNKYGLTLPDKTDLVIIDGDVSNGWAFANTNTITIWTHDFDFNLRGSHEWFDDVITHEYAHIVSINAALKFSHLIPEVRLGYFSHPNEMKRAEFFHSFPADVLPHWFTEGIAQYSSSKYGADSWDSHRDMILRTLTLSNKLLSWDHMQLFAGKGDDFEKTYNHGFSLVKYIAEKYGEDKISALLRESGKLSTLDFDAAIKSVFGKTGKQLYMEWKDFLYKKYSIQLDSIGKQIYGRRINKDGYDNYWPRFSPDGNKIYFLSNGKNDYGFKLLYIADISDTAEAEKSIKPIAPIKSFYDLHFTSGKIAYISSHPKKSVNPPSKGGNVCSDLFIDFIPKEKKKFLEYFKNTEKQLTQRQSIYAAVFSPSGDRLAFVKRDVEKFYLGITDTTGKLFKIIYPFKDSAGYEIGYIYSLSWSIDGKSIAFSYFDRGDRKIAIFDTSTSECRIICDTKNDERDPFFSPDGKYLYFSSDRTGIFNIYRYELSSGKLQRITNVAGGAFAPAVSNDGKKLVYAGYDANGYGIFLLDTIVVVEEMVDSSYVGVRTKMPSLSYNVIIKDTKPYSYLPRQFLLVPSFFTEQAVSQSENVNKGVSVFKGGLIFNILDPLTLSELSNEIGGFLFLQPNQLLSFVNPYHRGINIGANYDLGLYGVTRMLPFTLSGDYMLRGIAGVDWFFNETEGEMEKLPYRLDLHNLNLQMSHFFSGGYSYGSIPRNELAVHLLSGFERYNANLLLESYGLPVFSYNISNAFKIGGMGTFSSTVIEPTQYISPRGIVSKIQFNLCNLRSLREENSFDASGKEQYNNYLFYEIKGHVKVGTKTFWAERHGFHIDIKSTLLKILKQDTTFPSYYLPGEWIPGYSYYYRDTRIVETEANPASVQSFDTLLVTGKAVVAGELSYRFPLSPKLIDKKLSFLYFERIYGAFNFNFGAGWDNPKDFFKFLRKDWLFAYGAELRIETISFYSYPFDIKIRWDYGADRPVPLGGHRFTFSIGYDFDNWDLVLSPDYKNKLELW